MAKELDGDELEAGPVEHLLDAVLGRRTTGARGIAADRPTGTSADPSPAKRPTSKHIIPSGARSRGHRPEGADRIGEVAQRSTW